MTPKSNPLSHKQLLTPQESTARGQKRQLPKTAVTPTLLLLTDAPATMALCRGPPKQDQQSGTSAGCFVSPKTLIPPAKSRPKL